MKRWTTTTAVVILQGPAAVGNSQKWFREICEIIQFFMISWYLNSAALLMINYKIVRICRNTLAEVVTQLLLVNSIDMCCLNVIMGSSPTDYTKYCKAVWPDFGVKMWSKWFQKLAKLKPQQFYINWSFTKQPKRKHSFWATFVSKFGTENFKKSPNLIWSHGLLVKMQSKKL